MTKVLTNEIRLRLIANGREQEKAKGTKGEKDFYPVVKLFMPNTSATWLLTEIDPKHRDIAFGLCDLGLGFPELGSVSIRELLSAQVFGLGIERDRFFKADKPISEYARLARQHGRIVTGSQGLSR